MDLQQKYELVRSALVSVVDCDDPQQLQRMKEVMEAMAPQNQEQLSDKQKSLKAISALLATQDGRSEGTK